MKRVLVPLDGTKKAEAAIASLTQFCNPDDDVVLIKVEKPEAPQRGGYRPSGATMAAIAWPEGGVASVSPPDVPFYVETGDQASQRQLAEAKDYLEGLAGRLRSEGLQVETEVLLANKPDEAIIEYAKKMRPTFIAMLRRTHEGIAEVIFGSVASSVMRADVAPVLFVPPQE